MNEIDRWILARLWELNEKTTKFYDNYDFHLVYYHVLNFCVNDLSAIYLDVLKDRLYTFYSDSKDRRSAQTALHAVLLSLLGILSPILSFTSEDLWQTLPPVFRDHVSALLAEWPKLPAAYSADEAFRKRWEKIVQIRSEVYAVVEEWRNNKAIRQPLEAEVRLVLPEEEYVTFRQDRKLFEEFLVVSKLEIEEGKEAKRVIRGGKFEGQKCARCWRYYDHLSKEDSFSDICDRCLTVVKKISSS